MKILLIYIFYQIFYLIFKNSKDAAIGKSGKDGYLLQNIYKKMVKNIYIQFFTFHLLPLKNKILGRIKVLYS